MALSRFVEEFVHETAQLTLVAKEPLQRARQSALAVGEVLSQDRVKRGGCAFVCGFRLPQQPLEFGPDRIDVHRDADALDRREADPQGSLHQRRVLLGRSFGEEGRQRRVVDDQMLDHDPIGLDADARLTALR
jgi:hypothetical protein